LDLIPAYLRLWKYAGFGKRVRREFGPEWHIVKEGTPTMGGLLLTAIVIALALLLDAVDASTYAVLLALLGVTLLGAFDDWLNARTGDGISARQKLLLQTGGATTPEKNLRNRGSRTQRVRARVPTEVLRPPSLVAGYGPLWTIAELTSSPVGKPFSITRPALFAKISSSAP